MRLSLDQLLHGTPFPYDSQMNQETGEVTTQMDIPGVKKEDLSIKVEDSLIKIHARREPKKTDDSVTSVFEQRWVERSVQVVLPEDLDPESLKASYENGVLSISIQKKASAKPKSVDIQFS